MSRYGNYKSNIFNAICRELPSFVDVGEYIKKAIEMDIKEINKMLEKKDLSPEMKEALEKRKEILTNDKEVKKDDLL